MIIKHSKFNRLYQSIVEHLKDKQYDFEITNRKGEKLYEFINPCITLLTPENCFATCRDMSLKYLAGELEWYYKGTPYLEGISKYAKFWNNISDDGWSAVSNYGKFLLHDRNVNNFTQFEYALSCLINNPESKKAVMVLYNKDHARKSKDNPCTMYMQFFIRRNELHLFVKMRSSDMWFGMPYDVPFFVSIQFLMLTVLKQYRKFENLEMGYYNHQSGSLHIYDRNFITIQNKIIEYKSRPIWINEQKDLFNLYIKPIVMKFMENKEIRVFNEEKSK